MKILEKINSPKDLKSLSISELNELAAEIRELIIDTVFENGGHLSSNLGDVELIIALEYVFDLPKDKLIFDVGHQCYAHKILTGRYKDFPTLRLTGGISGFPKREESEYDVANTGHASTSLSLSCGLVRANLGGEVISLIGDGSMTGGLVYEALNDMASMNKKQIIVLNDNNMSISKTVGFISKYLNSLHAPNVSSRPFVEFGVDYLGNIDGHSIEDLINAFTYAKNCKKSIMLHTLTIKGKGLTEAELNPTAYHGYSPIKTDKPSFSEIMGSKLTKLAKNNHNIFAITAAMEEGTGLECFEKTYKDRFIDVGICEEHAATMASGLAIGGKKPYFAVYSSFMQRSFDSILNDICLSNLPVTLCVDRAGIVSSDGETHQGIYDVAFLRLMPNMTIIAPKDNRELEEVLDFSTSFNAPLAIRYPKGNVDVEFRVHEKIEFGKWESITNNPDAEVIVLATGATMVCEGLKAYKKMGCPKNIELINARFIKPLDADYLDSIAYKTIITFEDNVLDGSFGSSVAEYYIKNGISADLTIKALKNNILTNASKKDLLKQNELDMDSIINVLKEFICD